MVGSWGLRLEWGGGGLLMSAGICYSRGVGYGEREKIMLGQRVDTSAEKSE